MTHQLPGLSQNEPIIVISVSNLNFPLKREKCRWGRSKMGCRPSSFFGTSNDWRSRDSCLKEEPPLLFLWRGAMSLPAAKQKLQVVHYNGVEPRRSKEGCDKIKKCTQTLFLLANLIILAKIPFIFSILSFSFHNTSFAILKLHFLSNEFSFHNTYFAILKLHFLSNEPNTGHEVTTDQFSEKSCSVSYVA